MKRTLLVPITAYILTSQTGWAHHGKDLGFISLIGNLILLLVNNDHHAEGAQIRPGYSIAVANRCDIMIGANVMNGADRTKLFSLQNMLM